MKTLRLLVLAVMMGAISGVANAQIKTVPQKAETAQKAPEKKDDDKKEVAKKAAEAKKASDARKAAAKKAAEEKKKAAEKKAADKKEKAKKSAKKSAKPAATKAKPVLDNSTKLNMRTAPKKQDDGKMSIQQKMKIVEDLMTESDTILSRVDRKIDKNKAEINDRLVILIYHKGNPEVTDSTNAAIDRFLRNNEAFRTQLNEVKIKWQDEAKKISDIYTEYGEKRQPTTPGGEPRPTEYDGFVEKHQKFLKLIERVEDGLRYVEKEAAYLRSVNG